VASGRGYAPGSTVELWIHSTPRYLATVTAAADGTFSTIVQIPSGTSPGPHSIVSDGVDDVSERLRLAVPITVVAATMPPTTMAGPSSGSTQPPILSLVMALLGVAMLATSGSLAYVEVRRRRG
jgi:hypothetical protein